MVHVQPSRRYRRADLLSALVAALTIAGLVFVLLAISAIVWPRDDGPAEPPKPQPAVTADRCSAGGCDI